MSISIGTDQTNNNLVNIVTGKDSFVVAPITNINVDVNTVVDVELFPPAQNTQWLQPRWPAFV